MVARCGSSQRRRRFTSEAVLVQEERILTWAMDAQADPASPSRTVERTGLDVLQADAAASVAGDDRLVLVVGPAGAGKTRMLAAAVNDLHAQRRAVFGVAPTAKAARVLERDTGMRADTVAKLLHEWQRPDRPPLPEYRLGSGTTLVVDEAGMVSTPALHQLVSLAEANQWRLVLVGDDRQLQAVGRGGLFAELCANGRVDQLERLHRFKHDWEAAASLQLRSGDPRALDAYEAHDRIIPGTLDDHLAAIGRHRGSNTTQRGVTVALVASTNDHVDAINHAVQAARVAAGQLNPDIAAAIAGGECAHVGDVVATRRNDRTLITSAGEPVRNRETWTVTAIGTDGSLTVTREQGHGTVTLPADYAHNHVRLGYAATEHGYQSDTVDHSLALVSAVTTRRGLYVAATRGRDQNLLCVVTDSHRRRRSQRHPRDDPRLRPRRHPRRHPTPHPRPPTTGRGVRDNRRADGALCRPRVVRTTPLRTTPRAQGRRAGSDGQLRLSGLVLRPRPPRRDATSPVSRQRPRRLVSNSPPPRDAPIRPGGSTPTHSAASTRPACAGDGPLATNSPPPKCAASAPSNTSNTPGTAPALTSTSTTRRGHASTRHKRRSIATTPGFGSAAPSTRSRSCDDRSKPSSCGIDGPAATPSTSSNSATPSHSSPATVAETSTPTSSEHSAKRHSTGPTIAGIDLPTRGRHTRTLERAGPGLDL